MNMPRPCRSIISRYNCGDIDYRQPQKNIQNLVEITLRRQHVWKRFRPRRALDAPSFNFNRTRWECMTNCSDVGGGYTSSEDSVFTIPAGNLDAGLVSNTEGCWKPRFAGPEGNPIAMCSRIAIVRCMEKIVIRAHRLDLSRYLTTAGI